MPEIPNFPVERVSGIKESKAAATQRAQRKGSIQRYSIEQIAAKRSYESFLREGFNEVAIRRNFKTLDEQQKTKKYTRGGQAQESEEEVALIEEVSKAEEPEARAKKQNPEFEKKQLILLRASISEKDSAEDILQKVLETFSDYTLADDALNYLLETSKGDLASKIREAKQILYDNFKRQIVAGKNMSIHARIISSEGLGSPSTMRDMYRDFTGNPQDPNLLFAKLSEKYNFENLRKVIRFLLHSLGSDLKSKGPSIPSGELYKLLTDVRILQAILGVYIFFNGRIKLIKGQFRHFGLLLPSQVCTENLAKLFMKLLNERYLASEKLIKDTQLLGVFDELQAQIILLTQFRDATRQIAPRLYRNSKQKEELLMAIIDTLEELEEDLEEKEEKEENGKKG